MRIRAVAGVILVVLLGAAAGTTIRRVATRPADAATAPSAPTLPPAPPRTMPVSGTLPAAVAAPFLTGRDSVVVTAVKARDCLTCEDLGRQIRELATATGEALPVVIAMPEGDRARVSAFVARERIRHVALVPYAGVLRLDGGDTIPTPAAFVLERNGRVRRGIAHLEREANVRTVSFARELGFLRAGLVPLDRDPSHERSQ